MPTLLALPVATALAVTPAPAPCEGWTDPEFWEAVDPATVRRCIAAGYGVEARSPYKEATPLHLAAAFNDDPEVIRVLVEAGADLEARSRPDEGRTPLHFAARRNRNPDVVRTLLQLGADAYATNPRGRTPLHLAALFNENPAILEELARVTDINVRATVGGKTPLHDATRKTRYPAVPDPNLSIVGVLLRHGADLSVEDPGIAPAGWADDRGVAELIEAEAVRREAIQERFFRYVTTRVAAGTVVLALLAYLWGVLPGSRLRPSRTFLRL